MHLNGNSSTFRSCVVKVESQSDSIRALLIFCFQTIPLGQTAGADSVAAHATLDRSKLKRASFISTHISFNCVIDFINSGLVLPERLFFSNKYSFPSE